MNEGIDICHESSFDVFTRTKFDPTDETNEINIGWIRKTAQPGMSSIVQLSIVESVDN